MKVVAIVGSIRKDSYNLKLAQTIQERYQDKFDMEIAPIEHLPFYNQDIEQNAPEVVTKFKKKVANADAVFIVTPEYNWSIPGVLKNALDWMSRVDNVLVNKPVLVAGASGGILGTIRAQLHLREILASPGLKARLLPPGGNEILVNLANQKFDAATGRLTDESTLTFLDDVVGTFIDFVNHS